MTTKERVLRILLEQDLWSVGEGDTFVCEETKQTFSVFRTSEGWEWRIRVNPEGGQVVHKYASASRLFRSMFRYLQWEW